MSTQKNTITINGKVYDIASGHVIDGPNSHSHAHSSKQHKPKSHRQIHPAQHMSDVIRPTKPVAKSHVTHATTNHKVVSDAPVLHSRPSHAATSSAKINHAKRKPAKTQTLARSYVKKPVLERPTATDKPHTPRVVELRKSIDHSRMNRAQKVKQSHTVSKFGHGDIRPVAKKVDFVAVVPAPKESHQTHDISHTPPVINSYGHSNNNSHVKKTSQSKDIFESALSDSKSHHKTYPAKKSKSKKGRWASIAAGSLTTILLIAFFVYQNIPSIALYTTSSKVGFNVVKPSYQPAGFGLKGPVEYEQGKVSLDFRSNSDDKSYTIEQTKTELDSASVMNSYLDKQSKDYSTEFANGRTVYIYGNNNATWVDGGVWYNLTNQANLPNDQLLKIVSSI